MLGILVAAVVPALVVSTITFLLGSTQGSATHLRGGGFVLRYGPAVRALPIVVGGLWTLILGTLVILEPPRPKDIPTLLGLGAIITITLGPLAIEFYGVRHVVTKDGIRKHTPWSRDLSVRWAEISSVEFVPTNYWYVIKTPRGKIRVSQFSDGLKDLRDAFAAHLSPEKWAQAERFLLTKNPLGTA